MKLEIITNLNEKGTFADAHARETLATELYKYRNKRVCISISDEREISQKQRGYLWSVIYPTIALHFRNEGNMTVTEKSLHSDFCRLFLSESERVNVLTGEVYKHQLTTSDLKMSEMSKFIESIILWASENLGIEIPKPNSLPKSDKSDLGTEYRIVE